MPKGLKRFYGQGHLHFVTCSCYRRRPLLGSVRARNEFVRMLGALRAAYKFKIAGYVVMPEHIHLLISEPARGTVSTVMQVLKQRASRKLRGRKKRSGSRQLNLWSRENQAAELRGFWQRRFYDFNVFTQAKLNEKLHYMHNNPLKRKLVKKPEHWLWSSYNFYWKKGHVLLEMDRV